MKLLNFTFLGATNFPNNISKFFKFITIVVTTFCTIFMTTVLVFLCYYNKNTKEVEYSTEDNFPTNLKFKSTISEMAVEQLPIQIITNLKFPISTSNVSSGCLHQQNLFCYTMVKTHRSFFLSHKSLSFLGELQ